MKTGGRLAAILYEGGTTMKKKTLPILLLTALMALTMVFAGGCGSDDAGVEINLGSSDIYDEQVRQDAVQVIREEIAKWEGCELHKVTYMGDESASEENLAWMNDIGHATGTGPYVEVIGFTADYHTPKEGEFAGAWEPDTEMTDWQFWLARPEGGDWEIVTNGY